MYIISYRCRRVLLSRFDLCSGGVWTDFAGTQVIPISDTACRIPHWFRGRLGYEVLYYILHSFNNNW